MKPVSDSKIAALNGFFQRKRHPKCKGRVDYWGDFDTCDYDTKLLCEDCKYGAGRKDPEAKCNQLK